MLTSFARIMSEHRKHRDRVPPAPPSASVRLKLLESRLEREGPRDLSHLVTGDVVCWVARRAGQ